jgi:hypothetical protein
MPDVARAGKVGVYVELPIDLRDRFKAFCKDRGVEFVTQVRMALERHLAYPPPPEEIAPLPDAQPARRRGRPKKSTGEQ